MQISEVRNDDGRACANLIQLLKQGRWDLSGAEAEQLVNVKKWVHGLALQMAEKLKADVQPTVAQSAPVPTQGIRIKSRGTIGSKKKKS